MFSSLCKVSRHFVINYNNCPKSILRNTFRYNVTVANAIRSQKVKPKKEPGDIFKWILLMIPVSSFGLGCWQVYRLQWKLGLIDMMQAKTNAAPAPMPQDFTELDKMEYMPVRVRGKFIHEKEILIGPRALIEQDSPMPRTGSLVSDPKRNQGWLVITPFMLADTGEVILINRGWIHQNLRPKEKREPSFVKGEVELVGVVRLSEKRAPFMPKNNPEKGSWFSRDLEQMSAHMGCAPVWLDARGIMDPPEGWPIPNQTRVTLRNEHLSYIVTWYSLSALTALMWHRFFIRKLPLL
ncbi:surfeit locus protein 1 [Anticarsia gemmatalis]|uniref:surfeit locus protein 1 n=1 Tax=Anticarsia gemmatalis TaxID=129554 RepID=UPI003F768908